MPTTRECDPHRPSGVFAAGFPVEESLPIRAGVRPANGVQRYIANVDNRPVDEVERADPVLACVAAQTFIEGTADYAYIYTTDTAAGEGARAQTRESA